MSDFDGDEWQQHLAETENLEGLWKWQLKKHLRYFVKVQPRLRYHSQDTRDACIQRIELLRAEINHRRARKPSWVAIVSLLIGVAGLALGIHNYSRSSSTQAEARSTPTETPQLSPTETPSQ